MKMEATFGWPLFFCGSETERQSEVGYRRWAEGSVTTHYLLCPFMTLYALWYPRMKRAQRVTKVRKGHKGHKGHKG